MTGPRDLPSSLAAALRPVLPDLAEATIAAIGREVPDYARPMEGPFGQGVRIGVERALARFVDLIEDPGRAEDGSSRGLYVALGRGELRAGRSLDALLAAYRLGARIAWERFAAAAERAGHEPATLYALAGAIFSYIDAISAESVEGYAEEQSREAGERSRRRRAVARLLVRDDATPAELEAVAAPAGWPLPAELAALAITGVDEAAAGRLGSDVVAVADGDELLLAFVPDPRAPGRRAQLAAALRGAAAALGPAVPPARAHLSAARARAALRHFGAPGRLVDADEHLLELLLASDPVLAAEVAERVLGPVDALPTEPARRRALETLDAWLDHPGQITRIGERLHVHPQTVRYRVARLRELLGDRLDDPESRFALQVAIRLRRREPRS